MADLMRMGRLAVVATALVGLWAGGALAQQKAPAAQVSQSPRQQFRLDPNGTFDLRSDGAQTQNGGCTLVLTGHVQVMQDQARLVGQSAIAVSPKKGDSCGDWSKVDVDKDVYYVTPDATVRADHALYDLMADKVTFTGSVVLVRGKDVGTGSKLVMDLNTNDYTLDGPVQAVITPPAKNSAQKPVQ